MKWFLITLCLCISAGCKEKVSSNSDTIQQQQQEKLITEATLRTGMPNIQNFRERQLLKTILELRDRDGLVTYTYLENLTPTVVKGHTALGGKLTYLGQSVGYAIPYATQYTNPQKPAFLNPGTDKPGVAQWGLTAQADPNGLFSPASAEGSWVLLLDEKTGKTVPVYCEPRIVVSPFFFPAD